MENQDNPRMEHLDNKQEQNKWKILQPIVFGIRIQDTELTYICRISLALVSGALLCRVVPVRHVVPLASGALIAYVSAHLLHDHHILPINASLMM
jgi:hypothetical protein